MQATNATFGRLPAPRGGRNAHATKGSGAAAGGSKATVFEYGSALFAVIPGECLKPETGWRSEVNSELSGDFVNRQ
jgi:hypothetical protein